jgi:hypothetical protein
VGRKDLIFQFLKAAALRLRGSLYLERQEMAPILRVSPPVISSTQDRYWRIVSGTWGLVALETYRGQPTMAHPFQTDEPGTRCDRLAVAQAEVAGIQNSILAKSSEGKHIAQVWPALPGLYNAVRSPHAQWWWW